MSKKRIDLWLGTAIGLGLIVGSYLRLTPYGLTETLGFVSGAACVYLVVKENVWNFPVGIANSIFFLVLFANAKLYGDAGLQIVYVFLGLQGWHLWKHGGANRAALQITRASFKALLLLSLATLIATFCLALILRAVKGAVPVLDALTTVLSLIAQYMLNKKYLENWYAWILADVIYVYIYLSRGLRLTALLYLGFLCLCVAGIRSWMRTIDQNNNPLKPFLRFEESRNLKITEAGD